MGKISLYLNDGEGRQLIAYLADPVIREVSRTPQLPGLWARNPL